MSSHVPLDARIGISEKYVKFHEDAEALNGEFESFELLLKEAKGDDDMDLVEAKWEQLQKHYLDLCNTGKAFCQEAKNVSLFTSLYNSGKMLSQLLCI